MFFFQDFRKLHPFRWSRHVQPVLTSLNLRHVTWAAEGVRHGATLCLHVSFCGAPFMTNPYLYLLISMPSSLLIVITVQTTFRTKTKRQTYLSWCKFPLSSDVIAPTTSARVHRKFFISARRRCERSVSNMANSCGQNIAFAGLTSATTHQQEKMR